MNTNRQVDINIAHNRPLRAWNPAVGDFIVIHGIISHSFGVVSAIDRNTNSVRVIKAGLPALLFKYAEDDMDKNVAKINISKIKNSRTKYSVVSCEKNTLIWYIP
jgi:hypothetical protein